MPGQAVVQHTSTATSSAVSDFVRLRPAADLPQRLRTTSLPRVRIEGVRGSNPLSSTSRAGFEHGTGPSGVRTATLSQPSSCLPSRSERASLHRGGRRNRRHYGTTACHKFGGWMT